MSENTYNGWKNYETWNVVLWFSNDVGLYHLALECSSYKEFVFKMQTVYGMDFTPDGVSWNDSTLDFERLDDVIKELKNDN